MAIPIGSRLLWNSIQGDNIWVAKNVEDTFAAAVVKDVSKNPVEWTLIYEATGHESVSETGYIKKEYAQAYAEEMAAFYTSLNKKLEA